MTKECYKSQYGPHNIDIICKDKCDIIYIIKLHFTSRDAYSPSETQYLQPYVTSQRGTVLDYSEFCELGKLESNRFKFKFLLNF